MKQIVFELKKLRADKPPIAFFAIAICAVLLFSCMRAEPIAYNRHEVQRILDAFESSPEQTYRTWLEKQQAYRAYLDDGYADELPPFLSDYDAYRRAWEMFSRQTRYHDRLESVLQQTQGTDAVSLYISALYGQNQSLKLSHADMQLLPKLFDALSFASALAVLLSVLLGISIAFADRKHGMEQLLFVSAHGRMHTRCAKVAALCLCTALVCTLLFLAALIPFLWQNEGFAWNAYLQNHESFFVCPYPFSVVQAVLLLFLLTWLGSFSIGMSSCICGKYIPHQAVALPLAAFPLAVFGTSTLFATPDGRSLLHLISPFSFCDGNIAFGHLYGVPLGAHAAGGLSLIALTWALFCISLCTVYIIHHVPAARASQRKKRSFGFPSIRVPRFVQTAGAFEIAKQAVCNKAVMLFLPLLFLFAWQLSSTLVQDESYTEQTYRTYMQNLQGTYTPEKQQIVDEALAQAQNVLDQKQEKDALFASGKITQTEMTAYMRRFGNAQASEQALYRVAERLAFVRSHPDAAIVYEGGWELLYSFRLHLFPVLLICAVCCGLFADEYKSGMHRLFPAPARTRISKSKYLFALCFACATAFGFEAVQLAVLASRFALALPFAPSASIPQMQALGSVPLLCAACASVLRRVLGCLLAALICTLCSRLLRQKHAAFVCGVLCALPWVMG